MDYRPENDGISHINIFSRGKTHLGRLLSNFAHTPVKLEGRLFASIEAYWYWLMARDAATPGQLEHLQTLHGSEAKKFGRTLPVRKCAWTQDDVREHEHKIKEAFKEKLIQHPALQVLIGKSELPFAHYYDFDGKVVNPKAYHWQVEYWEELRTRIKRNTHGKTESNQTQQEQG